MLKILLLKRNKMYSNGKNDDLTMLIMVIAALIGILTVYETISAAKIQEQQHAKKITQYYNKHSELKCTVEDKITTIIRTSTNYTIKLNCANSNPNIKIDTFNVNENDFNKMIVGKSYIMKQQGNMVAISK